jgi:hypothetical protein
MANTTEYVKDILSDYKEHMSWILLVYAVITTSLQYYQNVRLAKKVEKYKNELAKNEIKFSRHSEMQIECLKNMYEILVESHYSLNGLLNPIHFTHHSFKKNVALKKNNFAKLIDFTHRNRILITDEIIEQFKIVHSKFQTLDSLCADEVDDLIELEDYECSSEPERIYKNPQEEIELIKERIIKLKKNTDIQTIDNETVKLRKSIEKYFKELVS